MIDLLTKSRFFFIMEIPFFSIQSFVVSRNLGVLAARSEGTDSVYYNLVSNLY